MGVTSVVLSSLKPWQKIALSLIAAVLLGYSFGRYTQPAKIQIQTQSTEKEDQTVHHDTVTQTVETKKPDGTVVIDTTVTDKDLTQTNISDTSKSSETITNNKPQWKVQGLVGVQNFNPLNPIIYGADVERRIIGPISVGVWGNNNREAGVSLSIEF